MYLQSMMRHELRATIKLECHCSRVFVLFLIKQETEHYREFVSSAPLAFWLGPLWARACVNAAGEAMGLMTIGEVDIVKLIFFKSLCCKILATFSSYWYGGTRM